MIYTQIIATILVDLEYSKLIDITSLRQRKLTFVDPPKTAIPSFNAFSDSAYNIENLAMGMGMKQCEC